MTRTTSQGLLVYEDGDPSSVISAGMPTADSVDAAIARFADASELADQAYLTAQAAAASAAAAELAAQGVLDSADLAVITAARDAAIAAKDQAQIIVGAAADDAEIDAAIASVVATASDAHAAVQSLVDGSGDLLPARMAPALSTLRGVVSVAEPRFGLAGTADNTAAVQAAITAAADEGKPLLIPTRPLGQPYVLTGGGTDAVLLKASTGQVIAGDGPRTVLKVKDGTGNYKAIIGGTLPATDLSGLVVRDLTIDQNSGGNPVSNVASLYVQGTQRFGVFVGVGSGIRIDGVRFVNVDSLNVLYLGGAAMKDVRVQDCDFDLIGSSTARHDHSTIYTSCDGTTLTGNKFRGIASGLGATTAIETHGPSQVIVGNRVEGYQIGANITGITGIGNDGVLVSLNTFRNVLIGIQLWSWSGTNGGLKDCQILDNYVLLDRDAWYVGASDFPRGICVAQSAGSGQTLDHIDGLTIRGNRIRFKTAAISLTNDYSNASGIELINTDTTIEVRNLLIASNVVVGALGPGIRLQMRTRIGKVHDNLLINCSATAEAAPPSFWRSGIVLLNDHADLDMWGNRIHDTRAVHKLVQGFATSISGSMVRCEQWDNRSVCTDGTVLPESSQTVGKRFAGRAAVPDAQLFTAALYYGAHRGGAAAQVLSQETATGFRVSSPQSFDRIGCEVTTAGAAGAVVRLGIRADDGGGRPGALVLDAGTVDATTTGAKEITIAKLLPAGLYWLTATAQVAACSVATPSAGTLSARAGVSSLAVATNATPRPGYYQSAVAGALPASFTMAGQTSTPGLVVIRAA